MEKSNVANVALGLLVSAFIVPVFLYAVATIFFETQGRDAEQSLSLLFAAFMLGALICGVAGWSHRHGKITVILAVLVTAFLLFFLLAGDSGPEKLPSIEKSPIPAPAMESSSDHSTSPAPPIPEDTEAEDSSE